MKIVRTLIQIRFFFSFLNIISYQQRIDLGQHFSCFFWSFRNWNVWSNYITMIFSTWTLFSIDQFSFRRILLEYATQIIFHWETSRRAAYWNLKLIIIVRLKYCYTKKHICADHFHIYIHIPCRKQSFLSFLLNDKADLK